MASMVSFGIAFFFIQVLYLFHFYPSVVSTSTTSNVSNGAYNNYSTSCLRDCTRFPEPRTCDFHFVAEWYYSMSKACYDCPFNTSDCLRPHCIALNGVQRPVLAINRQIPGPSIQVCQGDRIRVTVRNALDNSEGLTIHWHGQHQRTSPHMDGTSMITQCHIPRPQTFTYDFLADTPGTQWWHSHSGLQRADGLFGPVVVRQRRDDEVHSSLYDIDDHEHVIMMSDWTDTLSMQHMMKDLHADGPGGPDAILINGRGTKRKVFERNGKEALLPDSIFTVKQGLRYRFRTINTAVTNCPMEISISNHQLFTIASDGSPIDAITVDGIVVSGGERYDFVVSADKPIGNYAIQVRGVDGSECEGIEEVAILRYEGALQEMKPSAISMNPSATKEGDGVILNVPIVESTPGRPGVYDLRDAGPIDPDIVRPKPDVTHYIEVDSVYRNSPHLHHRTYYPVEQGGHMYTAKRTHMMNNISFALPTVPLLTHHRHLQAGSLCTKSTMMTEYGRDCEEEYCECTHTIPVKLNQVVELILVTKSLKEFEPHPLHLHGNHFYVISYDNGEQLPQQTIKDMDERGEIKRNLDRPPRKDTLMMAQRFTILRFKADNPGWWLFHCHMDVHLELGMAVVFHVGDDRDLPPPPSTMPVCVRDQGEHSSGSDVTVPECKLVNEIQTAKTPTFLAYVIISTVLFLFLAFLCLLNIQRKHKSRRNSVQYRRLQTGEVEMSLDNGHRSIF
ncbi:laccase-4-like [Strongylocentrotus purpuratus]|uniref:Uncharacterized protein n=1 Tax=Strongylocentrotus purpuratus TaxID=7668 RepID=A0A7M7NQ76_STRPU|nr:laccase-4-like [Strongylocentrotus purpuratus]